MRCIVCSPARACRQFATMGRRVTIRPENWRVSTDRMIDQDNPSTLDRVRSATVRNKPPGSPDRGFRRDDFFDS
jgi:hypothetical protein